MFILLLLLVGCPTPEETGKIQDTVDTQGEGCADADADGWCVDETDADCDDGDDAIHPGATEICDGIDQNCDTVIDEGVTKTFYADSDGDGAGNEAVFVSACDAPTGYVENANDCDDTRNDVHPGAEEVCDEVDQDCDEVVDEDVGQPVWEDVDGDGFGDVGSSAVACDVSAGWADNPDDCDDLDPSINPDAAEICDEVDQDCDGTEDEGATDASTWYEDKDGDEHGGSVTIESCTLPEGYAATDDDCDDLDATAHPGATEICDGDDETCDGVIDEEVDNDGDGLTGCAGDCDDSAATVYPGAAEHCNDTDDDCDGTVDEDAVDPTRWYPDGDGDGFGAGAYVSACDAPPDFVGNDDDCDDTTSVTRPGATEACDGADNDCDDIIDEGFDLDGDGYSSCGGDCDDSSVDVSPAANEWCNLIDDDCDGTVDEDAEDESPWYGDGDGDGFGYGAAVYDCDAPGGFVDNDDDCDDARSGVHPGAAETCNTTDDNCDGTVDEGFDTDGDGYTSCDGDCDDTNPDVSAGADELCNLVDDDCDGVVDDSAVDPSTWYLDADEDGVGRTDASVDACEPPSGYTASYGDCDDTDAGIYPGNTETCDGIDDNCDGLPDDGGVCPCDVDWYGGGTYMFCAGTTDALTARDECIAYNYHLVRIDDADEDTWLRDTAPTYGTGDWWIGLTDELFEGLFGWVYGPSTVPYTNWASGEPNNVDDEDCTTLLYGDLTWVDQDCGITTTWICEADTE